MYFDRSKVIELPRPEEMMRRLTAALNNDILVERFYPRLAQEGGKSLNAEQIADTFATSVKKFMEEGEYPDTDKIGILLRISEQDLVLSIVDDVEARSALMDVLIERNLKLFQLYLNG